MTCWPTRCRLRPTTFCERVGDVYTKALVNAMHYSLEEVETKAPVHTLRDLEAKESANKLTDEVADLMVEKVGGTLTDLKRASPV